MENSIEYEPMINNRYIVEFGDKNNVPAWAIRKVNLPTFLDNKITIHFYETKQFSAYDYFMNYFTADDMKFSMLDPTGVCVCSYSLKNITINDVQISEFAYENDDYTDVKVIFNVEKMMNIK